MLPVAVVAELAALAALLLLAGFFAMAETSMIGVSRVAVRRRAMEGSRRAKLLDRMLDQPERILSTVLVGATIVNISAAALATVIGEQLNFPFHTLVMTVALTLVVLVACELVPKTLAVQDPLRYSVRLAAPLRAAESIMKPVIGLATWLSKGLVRSLGVKAEGETPYITSDEIEMLVRMGVESGEVERFEQKVISELFDFTEKTVAQIMTPAPSVHWLPKSATLADAVRVANTESRSRIVVVDGSFDSVVGFVHVRDLLKFSDRDLNEKPVTTAVRSPMVVAADLRADHLLVRMQREHRSLAVVQDKGGRNVGLITADDLLEELVGELHDEFDAQRAGHTDPSPATGDVPDGPEPT